MRDAGQPPILRVGQVGKGCQKSIGGSDTGHAASCALVSVVKLPERVGFTREPRGGIEDEIPRRGLHSFTMLMTSENIRSGDLSFVVS